MGRAKRFIHYIDELRGNGYQKSTEFVELYERWKQGTDIKALSSFLDISWNEKDRIKPQYLGSNTYNNFRGTAVEEFCHSCLKNSLESSKLVEGVNHDHSRTETTGRN